jgi:hypothetical protein
MEAFKMKEIKLKEDIVKVHEQCAAILSSLTPLQFQSLFIPPSPQPLKPSKKADKKDEMDCLFVDFSDIKSILNEFATANKAKDASAKGLNIIVSHIRGYKNRASMRHDFWTNSNKNMPGTKLILERSPRMMSLFFDQVFNFYTPCYIMALYVPTMVEDFSTIQFLFLPKPVWFGPDLPSQDSKNRYYEVSDFCRSYYPKGLKIKIPHQAVPSWKPSVFFPYTKEAFLARFYHWNEGFPAISRQTCSNCLTLQTSLDFKWLFCNCKFKRYCSQTCFDSGQAKHVKHCALIQKMSLGYHEG